MQQFLLFLFLVNTEEKESHLQMINEHFCIPDRKSNIWINIKETLMPATANGYSQVARCPPCLNNNL
jgi:hypothetical protein